MRNYSTTPDRDVWEDWRELVNMTPRALESFLRSEEGREAGLSTSQARSLGIKSGQESARWILRMKPLGRTYAQAEQNWTPTMWSWARRQNAFIRRMLGNRGPLIRDGEATRKLTSLLVWGHDPYK